MMNYLKKFESFQTHEEIHKICKQYNITNYTINSDDSIDVNGDVNLYDCNLKKLPIRFNHVSGKFNCISNKLTTLEGSPKSINGRFNCSYNRLTTLKGGPQSVGGDFWCRSNKLTTLEGAPQSVDGSFHCSSNKLTTLEGSPQYVGGSFNCYTNNLTTLEGAPQYVGGIFSCNDNKNLKSLNYLPINIGTDEVYFEYTAVYEIFKLLGNDSLGMIRIVNDLKVVVDDKIDIEKLNDLLYDQGKPSVEKVKGYSNI